MKRLICLFVFCLMCGVAYAGVTTTITCDQCEHEMEPDRLCSRYSYYVLKRVDVETGDTSCADYNPPLYKIFCSLDCLRDWLEPDKGPFDGSVIIPGEGAVTLPYMPNMPMWDPDPDSNIIAPNGGITDLSDEVMPGAAGGEANMIPSYGNPDTN